MFTVSRVPVYDGLEATLLVGLGILDLCFWLV